MSHSHSWQIQYRSVYERQSKNWPDSYLGQVHNFSDFFLNKDNDESLILNMQFTIWSRWNLLHLRKFEKSKDRCSYLLNLFI